MINIRCLAGEFTLCPSVISSKFQPAEVSSREVKNQPETLKPGNLEGQTGIILLEKHRSKSLGGGCWKSLVRNWLGLGECSL